MGAFNINITGVGGHGCERKAKAGDKLYGRCGKFTCPDCLAYEFTQRLRQAGMLREGDTAVGQELKAGDVPPEGAEIYCTDHEGRLVATPVPDGKTFWRILHAAEFTHWPYSNDRVVDDMIKNERRIGSF
jgi:hypothetical protein